MTLSPTLTLTLTLTLPDPGPHPTLTLYNLLQPDGALSSVVVAGSNAMWPAQATAQMPGLESRVRGAAAVMLQREVPEHVNAAVAAAAASAGVPVLQDVGGEDR